MRGEDECDQFDDSRRLFGGAPEEPLVSVAVASSVVIYLYNILSVKHFWYAPPLILEFAISLPA